MPMTYKSSTSSSKANPPDPSLRDPRVHRQSGIPSISRPRLLSNNSVGPELGRDSIGGGTSKKAVHHLLSKTSDQQPAARRRFASMPLTQPLSQSDAFMTGSPPIVDFTKFEDTYRGPRSGEYEGLIGRRSKAHTFRHASESYSRPNSKRPATPSVISKSIPLTGVPLSASARKPDPRLILSSLENIFGDTQNIDDYLNAHDLLAMHQLDQVDFENRDRLRVSVLAGGKLEVPGQKGVLAVLGEPIRKASIYSSTSMVLAGREHELPIIVVNTVEELYRTGIYQPNLFRTLPNRSRLLELIDIYDSATQPEGSVIRSRQPTSHKPDPNAGFGANTSLHLESTPDICALLTTYLSSLPEPIFPQWLFRPLWDWCALDNEGTEAMQRNDSFGPRISHIPMARTYTSPAESTHILIAQLLFQLLPSPHFSLLVYLLAFFSQAALVREENGVGVSDLSRMFGGRIFGGESMSELVGPGTDVAKHAKFNITQMRRTGETVMSWFLRRWGPLSEGLFDVVDDAKMGIFHRTVARRDSLGKDILHRPLSLASSSTDSVSRYSSESEADSSAAGPLGSWDSQTGRESENYVNGPRSLPRIHLDGIPLHSTPKARGKGKGKEDCAFDVAHMADEDFVILSPSSEILPGFPDETLDITHLPSRTCEDVASISSTPTLDERLMDISMPTLLNQTLPIQPSLISPLRHKKSIKRIDREVQTIPTNPIELVHALQIKAHLEAQLSERTESLTNALKALAKSKLVATKLQARVRELESELELEKRAEADGRTDIGFRLKLEETTKERDDAQCLVSEIKKLIRD